jgi:hypothetical protein
MSQVEQQQQFDTQSNASTENRSPDQVKEDNELAERLSSIIEDANSRVVPLCQMMRKVRILRHIFESVT